MPGFTATGPWSDCASVCKQRVCRGKTGSDDPSLLARAYRKLLWCRRMRSAAAGKTSNHYPVARPQLISKRPSSPLHQRLNMSALNRPSAGEGGMSMTRNSADAALPSGSISVRKKDQLGTLQVDAAGVVWEPNEVKVRLQLSHAPCWRTFLGLCIHCCSHGAQILQAGQCEREQQPCFNLYGPMCSWAGLVQGRGCCLLPLLRIRSWAGALPPDHPPGMQSWGCKVAILY